MKLIRLSAWFSFFSYLVLGLVLANYLFSLRYVAAFQARVTQASKRTYHKTPTLEEITHQFSGARVFSKLDARHGYWSIELDSESSYLTTFNSPFGRYRFQKLPFGLKVSQDIFQEKMDMILEQCPGTLSIADDVAVFGKDLEQHDENLHNLMQVARKYGLIFNAIWTNVTLTFPASNSLAVTMTQRAYTLIQPK